MTGGSCMNRYLPVAVCRRMYEIEASQLFDLSAYLEMLVIGKLILEIGQLILEQHLAIVSSRNFSGRVLYMLSLRPEALLLVQTIELAVCATQRSGMERGAQGGCGCARLCMTVGDWGRDASITVSRSCWSTTASGCWEACGQWYVA
jgi:hypothetical protein